MTNTYDDVLAIITSQPPEQAARAIAAIIDDFKTTLDCVTIALRLDAVKQQALNEKLVRLNALMPDAYKLHEAYGRFAALNDLQKRGLEHFDSALEEASNDVQQRVAYYEIMHRDFD